MLNDYIICGRLYNVSSSQTQSGYTVYSFDFDCLNYKGEVQTITCETYSKKITEVKFGTALALRGRKFKKDSPFAVSDYDEIKMPAPRRTQPQHQQQSQPQGYNDNYDNVPF